MAKRKQTADMTTNSNDKKSKSNNVISHMEIPFATNKDALIAYNSLRIDKEPLRGNVIKELEVQDKLLIVNISANDPKKLRSAVSSFMDFLILVINTIEKFGLSPS
ncbi:EKC/KEOPS complex subunit Lage3 [Parasteatoda tepidariorum]|uniref:EKC/KEOPS complex subunit Lage3 n=1 Tax=Parasteatoda tepidariorum TaxID=114398 RepID=UPI001C71A39B|nr:uncharacterized protein LOC107446774 [Parasteatoda tepidariorum]